MTFYERLETLRKEKGLSQAKLEKELGFSNGSISKWKKSKPTYERLQKIADYFGVSTRYLLGDDFEFNKMTPMKDIVKYSEESGMSISEILGIDDLRPEDINGCTRVYEVKANYNNRKERTAKIISVFSKGPSSLLKNNVESILEEHGILYWYDQLNSANKQKAKDYIDNLMKLQIIDEALNAAHTRTDIDIPEGVDTSDDDIMDDENF